MKFVLVTKDEEMAKMARAGIPGDDELQVFQDWEGALDATGDADMMLVDLLATLTEEHKIGGYEAFANAKMAHEKASAVPLVLISPPEDYELDFMVGWPDFVFGHLRRPVTEKLFRRASTWI